jgi:hypothetical protein
MRATSKVLLDPDSQIFHWTDGARRPWCDRPVESALVPVEEARELGYLPCSNCRQALHRIRIEVPR